LRQQVEQRNGVQRSLADFIAPSGDHIGCFAVSIEGIDAWADLHTAAGNDYDAILVKAVGDRLAEALAEWLHEQVRKQHWGYSAEERLSNAELIAEAYRGIRPAPGYPACPDHVDKRLIWQLLDVEKRTGAKLTDSLAIQPAAAVSGYYFAHPESRYLGVGLIGEDQLNDHATRRGMSREEDARWLAPNLLEKTPA
jgi:5-methyltetrahydrofolate--homocysteine methyltransferase